MILKKLEKYLEFEKVDKNIFDIIIYGSLVKGKYEPRDIDILVIFLEGNLKERLEKIQEIKINLKKLEDADFDIKQILLKDLFSSEFMARAGIFLEGISIFRKKKFCETLGFKSYSLFYYNMKNLSHTQKIKFNYILAGRKTAGIIESLNGERLAMGAIKIPIENSFEFEDLLKKNDIDYKKRNILEEL